MGSKLFLNPETKKKSILAPFVVFILFFETGSQCTAQANLELMILLSQCPDVSASRITCTTKPASSYVLDKHNLINNINIFFEASSIAQVYLQLSL